MDDILEDDVIPAEISPKANYLILERDRLKALDKELNINIEIADPQALREQIQRTYSYLPKLGILGAQAERDYRAFQKKAVHEVPKTHKSDNRKMWLDGYCSNYRYQRDILLNYFNAIKAKLSAQKSIISSLNQEHRDSGMED